MNPIAALSNKTISIRSNDFLKVKGSVDTQVYFVESGSLRTFVMDKQEDAPWISDKAIV